MESSSHRAILGVETAKFQSAICSLRRTEHTSRQQIATTDTTVLPSEPTISLSIPPENADSVSRHSHSRQCLFQQTRHDPLTTARRVGAYDANASGSDRCRTETQAHRMDAQTSNQSVPFGGVTHQQQPSGIGSRLAVGVRILALYDPTAFLTGPEDTVGEGHGLGILVEAGGSRGREL